MTLQEIYSAIEQHPANAVLQAKGYSPVYSAHAAAKVMIVGQAPGIKAQTSGTPWNDISGNTLRQWLGLSRAVFYNPEHVALVPMDFYYPGKGAHGDLPPRKDFAAKWHPLILAAMPQVRLVVLVGAYAQKYYLGHSCKPTLTQTVHAYKEYLPRYFPLVHPSPLNWRWQSKNSWFKNEVVPAARRVVHEVLEVE